ncbi:hypothetical protein Pmani_015437 [Petrolisthes manimaculis]|uniref:Uncharacterized protein n=1 Tax=Petrolisthes manimaculis TaxID=1843537 RepID=A0AAE1U9W4_9EUCA|nr:hypothetical protein Pmani_015437 [Petrolisthes manimaculis]
MTTELSPVLSPLPKSLPSPSPKCFLRVPSLIQQKGVSSLWGKIQGNPTHHPTLRRCLPEKSRSVRGTNSIFWVRVGGSERQGGAQHGGCKSDEGGKPDNSRKCSGWETS